MKQLEKTRDFIFLTNERGKNGESKVADMLDDLNFLESRFANDVNGGVQAAMGLTKDLRELLLTLAIDARAIEFDERGE